MLAYLRVFLWVLGVLGALAISGLVTVIQWLWIKTRSSRD